MYRLGLQRMVPYLAIQRATNLLTENNGLTLYS